MEVIFPPTTTEEEGEEVEVIFPHTITEEEEEVISPHTITEEEGEGAAMEETFHPITIIAVAALPHGQILPLAVVEAEGGEEVVIISVSPRGEEEVMGVAEGAEVVLITQGIYYFNSS